MDKDHGNIISKVKSVLIILFIMILVIIFFITKNTKDDRIDYLLKKDYQALKVHYLFNMKYFKKIAQNNYEQVISDKKALEIFSNAYVVNKEKRDLLRTQLYQRLKKQYGYMKNLGVLQFHFVFPDNTSFLRFHKPSKNGDSLNNVRKSYEYIHKNKVYLSGLEQGKTTPGFRHIFPIIRDGIYIGLVDISFSPKFIQESLIESSRLYSHFLVKKDLFKVKKWQRNDNEYHYIPSLENEDYMFAVSDGHNLENISKSEKNSILVLRKKIKKYMQSSEGFSLYKKEENKYKIFSFFPIKNIKSDNVSAYIVSHSNNRNIGNIINDFLFINMILFIMILLLLYIIYINIIHKILLKEEVVKKIKLLRKKDKMLIQQSKLATMGEMIGNIAHQWRQPLNAVAVVMMKLELMNETKFKSTEVEKMIKNTNDSLKFMSNTIDDFRRFFSPTKKKKRFIVSRAVFDVVNIVNAHFTGEDIKIEVDDNLKGFTMKGYKSELEQVILNLLNNAKDAIIKRRKESPYFPGKIKLLLTRNDFLIRVTVLDNGGGINKNIIKKIFDPYFTTKFQSKGTGIGLYMSKMIIENDMGGELKVHNINDGALFEILIKIKT